MPAQAHPCPGNVAAFEEKRSPLQGGSESVLCKRELFLFRISWPEQDAHEAMPRLREAPRYSAVSDGR